MGMVCNHIEISLDDKLYGFSKCVFLEFLAILITFRFKRGFSIEYDMILCYRGFILFDIYNQYAYFFIYLYSRFMFQWKRVVRIIEWFLTLIKN